MAKFLKGIEPEGSVRPQAVPYSVNLTVPKDEMDEVLEAYFKANKKRFEQQLMHAATETKSPLLKCQATELFKKFRRGKIPRSNFESLLGTINMYAELWEGLLRKVVKETQTREILVFSDGHISSDDDSFFVQANVYFAPEVILPEGFDPKDIEATVTVRTEEETEDYVTRRIEAILKRAVVPTEKEGEICVGDGALVSITGTVNGEQFAPASIKNHMLYTGDIEWDSPFRKWAGDILSGRKAGEQFTTDAVEWEPGVEVQFHVHVHKVFTVTKTPPEDFIKSRGHETMGEWREALKVEYRDAEARGACRSVQAAVERKLREVAEMSPLPSAWLTSKVNNIYQRMVLQRQGKEEQVWESLGVGDRNQAYNMLAGNMTYEAEQMLLVQAYARAAGLDTPSELNGMDSEFTDGVWAWAEKNIKVDRLSTEELKARRATAERAAAEQVAEAASKE